MRLKLNRTLRAALIAAITTVGFTLPQTYATSQWSGGASLGDWFYTENGKTGSTLLDDEHAQVNITAEGSTPVTAGVSQVTVKDGATVRISGSNYWGADRSFAALTIEDITTTEGDTGSILLSTEPYTAGKPASNTTVTVKSVTGTLTGVQNYGVLTLGTDISSINASGTLNNNSGATLTLNGAYTFDTANAAGYTVKQEGTVVWSDTEKSQGFKTSTGASYYVVKGATEGGNLSVMAKDGQTTIENSGGDYYFTSSSSVTDYTKFYVKAATATLEHDGEGQIIVEAGGQGGSLTVKNAKYRDTSGSKNLNIIVDDKGVLEVTHSGSNGYVTGDITIKGGGTFRVAGQHDAFGWGGGTTKNIILQGEAGKIAELQLQQTTGNSVTMNANLQLKGYAHITTTKNGFNTHDGAITAEGVDNSIDKFQLRHALTIEVKESGELTVGEMVYGNDGTHNLTKTGAGTLTFTGTANMQALNLQDGSLVIAGGTTTVAGDSTSTLNKTITVNAGSLVLNGTYEIGGNKGSMTTNYVGGETEGNVNGFQQLSGQTTVYAVKGGSIDRTGATFTVGGSAVTVSEDGIYTAAGEISYDTFYVTTGTESLAHAIDYAAERGKTVSTVAMSGTSTITMDKAGASVGLTLAEGASGTLDTTAAATLTGVSGAGALTKTGNETLTINGSNTGFTGDVTISGGTVKIGNQKALGEHNEGRSQTKTITIAEGGTLDLNGITDANFKYKMSGGTLTNSGAALGYGSSQTTGLDLTADSTVHADNGHDLRLLARGYDPTALNLNSKTLTKTGTGLFALKNTTVSAGTIEVQGGEVNFEVDPAKGGSTAANITLKGGNVSGTMNVSANITIDAQETTATGVGLNMNSHDLALNVAEGKELTLTGTISNGASYTKDGAGTLNLGELGLTTGSFAVNAGTVNLESATKTGTGAYTLSGDGTVKLGLYGIDLQAGTLTMSGKYDISDVYVDGETTYEGGVNDGNGFAVMEGNALVVTIQEGATLATTGATFTWNGGDVAVDDGTGMAAVSGKNYGTFYVNTASETVTKAKSMEGSHGLLSAIYVEEGATLDVDQNINGSLVDTWSSGTVSIREGKTVTGTMEGVSLSGAGTYDLGSGVSTLGESTSLGEDWAGIVRISNVTKNNIDLAPFVNGTLSTVELKGFSGWTGNNLWKGLNPQNIKLTNTEDGGVAWYSNAYSSSKTDTAVYSGKWSGEGTYVTDVNAARYLNHTYSGDVSDWTGVFEKRGDGTSILTFIDNAEEVNVEIKRTAGTLNLVVGNGEDEFATVFNGEVTASSITVNEQASAEFNELHITSAIQNSGTVTLNCDLEVTGFQETSGESGYFDLNKQFSTDGNGYAGISDSYLTIVDGGTVQGTITVTQGETDYTLEDSGLALKGDHTVQYGTFYVNTDTVKVSDIAAAEHGTTAVKVAGGTLDVDQAGTGLDITVTNEGTLTGENLDVTQVGIIQYATALFEQGIQDGHVKISSDGEAVEVLNWEEATTKYSLNNSAMVVTAGSIEKVSAGDNVTVSNYLNVDDIVNIKGGALTLNGQEDAMTVQNITIGQNSTVAVTDQSGTELTITVEETLAATGDATLLANLEMADGSALLLDGVQKGVSIGSVLTMNTGIMLDEATLSALDAMAIGDTFWLIGAVDGKPMDYTGESGEDAWYDAVFSRTAYDSNYELGGDFNIMFSETDGFGLKKFSNTPEPTTGTLSLLALAALAARRRRK